MSTAPYQKEHLKSLTGLRFLAALSVFVAHVSVHWPQYDFGNLPYGAAGVSFFYVLSGFILTYVYGSRINSESSESSGAASKNSATMFSFRKFYLKRFARIWPLHFATLLISLFVVMGVQAFFNRPQPIGKLVVNCLLLQSWIPNYQWIYSLNGPAWSLSVEAFFYLVFPFLLLGGTRQFIGKYLLIIVGTIVALFLVGYLVPQTDDSWVKLNAIVHVNPLMRLFEFATGVGCGFLFLNRQSRIGASRGWLAENDSKFEALSVGALCLFFLSANWLGMYGVENKTNLPIGFWYWFRFCGGAPVFALLVLTFANTNGLISKFLSSRLMVYFGEISYSFYMIHMGVILVLVRQDWKDGEWVVFGTVISSFLISLALASVLYQLVELPFRRAIVDWFDGKGIRLVVATFTGSIVNWVKSPWFVPMLACLIGSGWFVSQYRFDIRDQNQITAIVAVTNPDIKNAQFEQDATLLGSRASTTDDGGLSIEMVWQLKKGRRSERSIKLLDANQKVIGRGAANRELFDEVLGDDTVIDRVTIPPAKMKGVQIVAIGFFDRERKAAVVDRGPRSARDRQLHVWTKQ